MARETDYDFAGDEIRDPMMRGRIFAGEPTEICPSCNGTGHVGREGQYICARCGGGGVIFKEDRE